MIALSVLALFAQTGFGQIPQDPCHAAKLLGSTSWLNHACKAKLLYEQIVKKKVPTKKPDSPESIYQDIFTGQDRDYGTIPDPFRNLTHAYSHLNVQCTANTIFTSESISAVIIGNVSFPKASLELQHYCSDNQVDLFKLARADIDALKDTPAAELSAEIKVASRIAAGLCDACSRPIGSAFDGKEVAAGKYMRVHASQRDSIYTQSSDTVHPYMCINAYSVYLRAQVLVHGSSSDVYPCRGYVYF